MIGEFETPLTLDNNDTAEGIVLKIYADDMQYTISPNGERVFLKNVQPKINKR